MPASMRFSIPRAERTLEPEATRPRVKMTLILAAASRLFRERGYGVTTMDAVAREADVSKATLYVYFSGKRELFAAVIAEEGERNSRALIAGTSGNEEMRAKLLRFGHAILALLLAPETIGAYRMVTAEAHRFPELGRAFYENGPARLLAKLEEFFAEAMSSGKLALGNPRDAAEQFVGIVRGDLMLRALLAIDDKASEAHQNQVIRSGVDAFYRAYRPEATSPGSST
jgi:AcrR family transcriptional regulator